MSRDSVVTSSWKADLEQTGLVQHQIKMNTFTVIMCMQMLVFCYATKVNEGSDNSLATKAEKFLSAPKTPEIEKAMEAIEKQIEYNFLKTLSAILITGPVRVQDRQEEIFKLMRSTLNGEIDFKPVLDKMPFLAKEDQTNRFILMLKTIRESERNAAAAGGRQFGGLQNLDKILDAASKINIKEVSGFLKEIPQLFEGVETIIDGVDEYF